MDEFQACIDGYSQRLLDQQKLAVQQGYWVAYYTKGKHPKPPDRVVESLLKAKTPHSDEVDVEGFLNMEAEFNKRRLS